MLIAAKVLANAAVSYQEKEQAVRETPAMEQPK